MKVLTRFENATTDQARPSLSILGSISEGKRAMTFEKDETLFSQGDSAAAIFYVQSGRVKVSVVSDEGREAVLAILGPHRFLGEDCLIGPSLRPTTATALEPLTVVQIEKRAMLRALRAQPDFAEKFMATLLKRVADLEEDMCDQLFNQSEKRLARVLLKLAQLVESEGTADAAIPILSHETLAEMVGTTRSRVNHFMNKFKKMDLIAYNGHCHDSSSGLMVKTGRLTDAMLQDRI